MIVLTEFDQGVPDVHIVPFSTVLTRKKFILVGCWQGEEAEVDTDEKVERMGLTPDWIIRVPSPLHSNDLQLAV